MTHLDRFGVGLLFQALLLSASSASAQSIIPAADGTATFVTRSGQRYIIDGGSLSGDGANLFHSFQEFGLSANEIADFLATPQLQNILGRVTGGNASMIDGLIQVSGGSPNLYLMNPAGIVFGSNASLNVPASFTATTADRIGFSNGQWFNTTGPNQFSTLTGTPNQFAFTATQPGSLVNAGNLAVPTGQTLMLLGGSVVNTGSLSAPSGNITVSAVPGESLVRVNQNGMLLNLEIQPLAANGEPESVSENPASNLNSTQNSKLQTPNSLSLPELLTHANTHHATGVTVAADGSLHLTGSGLAISSDANTATISGTLNASTPHTLHPTPQAAGSINILGDQISLLSAQLDASGPNGGGDIRIGGEFQGDDALPRASQVAIDETSTITADALDSGDGGRVIAWADELTRFYGNIRARGGANGGDGGFVEVSGKELLLFVGDVDASAPLGEAGTLLLDPKNVTISDANAPIVGFMNIGSGGTLDFSIAVAGTDILIGARANTSGGFVEAGQAFLFDSSGSLLRTFDNPNPVLNGRFGSSVTAAGDNLLIGAPLNASGGFNFAGQAFLFNRSGGLLRTFDNPNPVLGGRFGWSVAEAGTNLLMGAPRNIAGGVADAGQAFLFNPSGALLQTFDNPNPVAGGNFGNSLAASGNNLLISAPDNTSGGIATAGQAFLFNANGSLLQTFDNPNPVIDGRFGISVAIANNNLLIGATRNTSQGTLRAGQAFLFNPGGTLLTTFDNPNPVAGGNFGRAVSAVGDNLLIGATGNTSQGFADVGQAFVFDVNGNLLKTFENPNPTTAGSFGVNVTALGSNPVIGVIDGGSPINLLPGDLSFSNLPSQDFTIAASNLTNIANLGTDVVVQANNDITVNQAIAVNNANGNGGGLTFQAGRSIFVNADISTDNGDLTLFANAGTGAGTVSSDRDPGAASITVASGTLFDLGTGSLTATLGSGNGLANNARGDITLGNAIAGRASIENEGGSITTGNIAASNGILARSRNDLTTGNLVTNGSPISLASQTGAIATGNLRTANDNGGGSVFLNASTQITSGAIDTSSAFGAGGAVTLDPSGDVQVSWINTNGGTFGGAVDITAGQFFRATDSFRDRNGSLASISSAGGLSGGDITIRHGGGGIIPFIVGDATINGTAAAITSGDFSLEPFRVLPFTTVVGNVEVISTNAGPNPTDFDLDPLENQQIEAFLPEGGIDLLAELEGYLTEQVDRYLDLKPTSLKTLDDAKVALGKVERATGVRPALIYVFFMPRSLAVVEPESEPEAEPTAGLKSLRLPRRSERRSETLWQFKAQGLSTSPERELLDANHPIRANDALTLVLVTEKGKFVQRQIPNVTRQMVQRVADDFRSGVTDLGSFDPSAYLEPSQQLYQWILEPLEAELAEREIDNLVFIMDVGLRSLPLAALHDGEGFIIERFSTGLMPSLSLTDTRYVDIKDVEVLAMGASEFPLHEQSPLPGVPVEIGAIADTLWEGRSALNQDFTPETLQQIRKVQPFGILHLATHAEFLPGQPSNSYIQWWDRQLRFNDLRQEVQFYDPAVEMLVLSACKTAIGDPEAELGFAGLAVQTGVKTGLGSLWYVSDEGTMGLMTSFYAQLREAPVKAEALRQAQVAMLKGEVRSEDGQLVTPGGHFPLPPELAESGEWQVAHPYYWSGFTLVGNPW